jgi:hypothetical protein
MLEPGPTPKAGQDGVAFASFAPLNAEVFVVDENGSNARPLSPHPGWDANATAFSSDRSSPRPVRPGSFESIQATEICVMRRDGSDARCLTDNPFEDATPSWLPAVTSGSR